MPTSETLPKLAVACFLLVFKSLNGLAPKYIPDVLVKYAPFRSHCSSGSGFLVVPPARTKTYSGEAAFSVYGPHLWNGLPSEFIFKQNLKDIPFLFSCYIVNFTFVISLIPLTYFVFTFITSVLFNLFFITTTVLIVRLIIIIDIFIIFILLLF